MPSLRHDALVELCHALTSDVLALVARLLRGGLPRFTRAKWGPEALRDATSTELRADACLVLYDGERVVAVLLLEVQLVYDAEKLRTLPAYVGFAHRRFGVPVLAIVVTPSLASRANSSSGKPAR